MHDALAPALAVVLLAANPPAPPADTPPIPAPSTAIVAGHHIQPRATGPDGSSKPDISPADADEVEQLYQQLMHETAPDAGGGKASPPSR